MAKKTPFLMSGAGLAEFFGKSRNTISAWTDKGMPVYKRGAFGKEHQYNGRHAVCWYIGKEILEKKGRSLLNTLPTVLFGDAVTADDAEIHGYAQWRPRGLTLAKELGYSEKDFERALGELIESGLLAYAFFPTRRTNRG